MKHLTTLIPVLLFLVIGVSHAWAHDEGERVDLDCAIEMVCHPLYFGDGCGIKVTPYLSNNLLDSFELINGQLTTSVKASVKWVLQNDGGFRTASGVERMTIKEGDNGRYSTGAYFNSVFLLFKLLELEGIAISLRQRLLPMNQSVTECYLIK